jgi:Holliday junction resolvase RusA-like endonuclease
VETASDHEWPFKRDEKVFTRIYYLHRARRDTDVDNLSKPILDAISRKTNPAASPSILEDDNNVVWRLAVKINLTEDQYELPGDPVKVAELIEDETLQDIVVVEVGYVTSSIKITVGGGIES